MEGNHSDKLYFVGRTCRRAFYLRLQSYVHFRKSYHTHANLYDVKLPSYTRLIKYNVLIKLVFICFFTACVR